MLPEEQVADSMTAPTPIRVIDSHTAGEPTRVVIGGGPELGSGTLQQRQENFKSQHDSFRRTVILEPRGYEAMVGALLCEPDAGTDCETAILFFNNTGYLDMCGHGTIGVAATLAHQGRLAPGACKFQTPAGIIDVQLHDDLSASFTNVPSFVLQRNVAVDAGEFGTLVGDVAYGGNWFFITPPPVEMVRENLGSLLSIASSIRIGLSKLTFDGVEASRIDHVQFFQPDVEKNLSRNFVVCPGGEFDRSPCGTGTSSVLASLADSGTLDAGESWTQVSLTGGRFSGTFRIAEAEHASGSTCIVPTITGRAFVCAESTLLQQSGDPYQFGNIIKAGV